MGIMPPPPPPSVVHESVQWQEDDKCCPSSAIPHNGHVGGRVRTVAKTGRLSWSGHSLVTSTSPCPCVPLLLSLPATCRGTDEEEDPLK